MTVVINGTTGIDTGTGSLIAADSTTPTYLDLFEDTDNGSNYVRLIAPTSIASNKTITLPDGTGTVVVNNVNSALVSSTTITLTNQTAPEFTSIPSWVKRITLMFNGVSPSGAGSPIIQLGDSGGYETTGYLGSASTSSGSGTSNSLFTTGFGLIGIAASTTTVFSGFVTITLMDLATNLWTCAGVIGYSNAAGTTQVGAAKSLSATLDRVRLYIDGTVFFDAGTINIIYE